MDSLQHLKQLIETSEIDNKLEIEIYDFIGEINNDTEELREEISNLEDEKSALENENENLLEKIDDLEDEVSDLKRN